MAPEGSGLDGSGALDDRFPRPLAWVAMRSKIFFTAFLAYATTVVAITLLPIHRHPPGYWTGQPWWTVIHWIPGEVDAPSFVLNVIMLIPFGAFVPLLWRTADSVRRLALLAALSSAGIELSQFLLGVTLGSRRTVDINDLIANTLGALIGLLILRMALPSATHRRMIRP